MLKLLLCWRYLRTRYIALVSIVSVTLGVATMIVVNAVMHGFTTEMQERIHGILSDVVFESYGLDGFADPDARMADIQRIAGPYIESMTPTVQAPAMLSFRYGQQWVVRPVQLIGIDEKTQSLACDFGKYLQHPENRQTPSFALRDKGFDTHDDRGGHESPQRPQLATAGWEHRRDRYLREQRFQAELDRWRTENAQAAGGAAAEHDPFGRGAADNPAAEAAQIYDPVKEQSVGAVVGIALASYRVQNGNEQFLIVPGDDIKITCTTSATPPRAADATFTVVDFYESKMSEYDSGLVFLPIRELQKMRGMIDGTTGVGNVTAIQIKLKNPDDGPLVRDLLRKAFPPQVFRIETWRDKQTVLLAAVGMETAILNVLLFLIIAVAGFGILAIFYMIVVEKTRDVGILKSLGCSGWGVMQIFLGYGLSLGLVGSGAGLVIGLLFVANINQIADLLGNVTGHEVFDPSIYYFFKIPTIVDPRTVACIVAGAILIAVLASVLPARRAAGLHPVEALRYE